METSLGAERPVAGKGRSVSLVISCARTMADGLRPFSEVKVNDVLAMAGKEPAVWNGEAQD